MAKCSKCNTDVLGTFKFCHNCGSTLSRNATTGQTEIMTDSSNKRAEVPMTFENFRKRLSSARLENNKDTSKKRKKDENKEVMINVGIMKVEKGLLKPDKGKGMTLRVPVSIRKMELLRRSIDRHSAYNRLFDKDAEYTLAYPDGTEVLTLPGQPTQLFQLDSYKEDLGKPYNRITFYLVERCILDGDDEEDVDSDVVKTDPCQSTLDSPLERSKPLLSSHDVDNDVVETDPRQSTLDSKLEGSKPLLSNQDYPLTGTVFKPSSSDTQLTTLREMFPSTEEQCLKDALNSTHSLEEAINLMLSSSESPLQHQSAYASLLDINDFSDTEIYDDDVDNFSTAFKSDSTSFSRDISVKDLLLQLKQAEVKTDDFLRLKIRRKNIWEDTKFKFVNNVKHEDLKKSLKVQFIGEPAVDAGGPSREFFTLINSAGISRLMQDGVFMHNISYLENKEYSLFGKLTALGLLHGSPGPRCFSKSVVDYIVYGSYSALEPSIDEVPNVEVREALHRLNSITDAEEFKQEASFNSNYRFEAGYCKPIVTLADKAEFFRCISLHYTVLSSISELNQYIEGLTTCNVLTVVREHPNVLRSLFEVTAEVTADFLGDMFEAVYSPSDSNRFTVEQSIMFNFHQYLEDLMSGKVKSTIVQEHVGDKEVVLSPKHLLQFVTGSEEVPAVGFIPRPTINFTQEKRKLTANTCGNVLTIPVVGMTEYATFADEFTFCIMNSPGFGLI